MLELLKTWAGSCALMLGASPTVVKPLRPMPHFWWTLAALIIAHTLVNFGLTELRAFFAPHWSPRWQDLLLAFFASIQIWGCTAIVCLALASWLCTRQQKAMMSFSVATFWLLIVGTLLPFLLALWKFFSRISLENFGLRAQNAAVPISIAMALLLAIALVLVIGLRKSLQFCLTSVPMSKGAPSNSGYWLAGILASAVFFSAALAQRLPLRDWLEGPPQELLADEKALLQPIPPYNPERVIYQQQAMVREALNQITPGKPEVPELFALSFGSDDREGVFLNEVTYSKKLLEERFGLENRVLVLANHPYTTDEIPLASVSNLRAALRGLAARMNSEDILFLFLTTHGSEEHHLLVQQGPLPLNQITPAVLAKELKALNVDGQDLSQIILVSACYSGGYLDKLSADHRILMTASRSDRPSFGCGVDSDITFFGQAYFVEALNQSKDFINAFETAKKTVIEREERLGFAPSEPQIRIGDAALENLRAWESRIEAGDPVPFFPDPRNGGARVGDLQ